MQINLPGTWYSFSSTNQGASQLTESYTVHRCINEGYSVVLNSPVFSARVIDAPTILVVTALVPSASVLLPLLVFSGWLCRRPSQACLVEQCPCSCHSPGVIPFLCSRMVSCFTHSFEISVLASVGLNVKVFASISFRQPLWAYEHMWALEGLNSHLKPSI